MEIIYLEKISLSMCPVMCLAMTLPQGSPTMWEGVGGLCMHVFVWTTTRGDARGIFHGLA